MITALQSYIRESDINRIFVAHTIQGFAFSMMGMYFPIFLLAQEYSLTEVILFFAVMHVSGVIFSILVLVPLLRTWGPIRTLKLYYPIVIVFFTLFNLIAYVDFGQWVWAIAAIGGMGFFTYWTPINILFLRHSPKDNIGSNLSFFYALPKVFGIAGPLIAAVVISFFGFLPLFVIANIVLIFSYLPIVKVSEDLVHVNLHISQVWTKLAKRKKLFFLEAFDNIVEESEWFWAIFVFILIGTIESPGIVAALASLGSAVFAVLVGKKIDQGKARQYIVFAGVALLGIWCLRFFVEMPLHAYIITMCASFMMTMFVIAYSGLILRDVKQEKKDEEEFMILREIPVVLGRLFVFGGIILVAENLENFFYLPIAALVIILIFVQFFYRSSRSV